MGLDATRYLPAIALALSALAACTPPRPTWVRADEPELQGPGRPPPIELRGEGKAGERIHVVRAGENLFRIALQHDVDPDELADLNQISDPTRLAVGRELVLPGPKGRRVASLATTASARPALEAPAKRPQRAAPGIDSGPRPDRALSWPLEGVLSSRFGIRNGNPHDGIDLAAPEGTPIRAAGDGAVLYAGTQRGYGNLVILRHTGGLITIYAHNQKNLVREGDRVRVGEEIALVGRTGRATGPHCHFEVRQGTKPRDPLLFLP